MFSIILGSVMVPLTALALPTYWLAFVQANLTDTYADHHPALAGGSVRVYLVRVYAADAVDSSPIDAGRVDAIGRNAKLKNTAVRRG